MLFKSHTFLLKQGHPGKEGQSGDKGALVSFKRFLFIYIDFKKTFGSFSSLGHICYLQELFKKTIEKP